MTAGSYLQGLRRAAHIPVPHMAITFGQLVSTMLELEADRRSVPATWIPLLAIAYRADATRLEDLLIEQRLIL
jgi:hypothetical protein